MYIYKFTITYLNGHTRDEWLGCDPGESIASLKDRADKYVDDIEQDEFVASVKMTLRTVPGI